MTVQGKEARPVTTPSAEGARPADAGRASSPDSDVTDATDGTDTMDAPDSTQDPAGADPQAAPRHARQPRRAG